MLIRVSTSLWVVLREASRPQCSVASSCARTDGGTSAGAPDGLSPSMDMAQFSPITGISARKKEPWEL